MEIVFVSVELIQIMRSQLIQHIGQNETRRGKHFAEENTLN